MIHYLNNFFLATSPHPARCQIDKDTTLSVCHELGMPVASEKVEGPATILTFLCIDLDTIKMKLRLPPSKFNEILQDLDGWLGHQKTTKRHLLSLIGKLAFAVKISHLFNRQLITLAYSVQQPHH